VGDVSESGAGAESTGVGHERAFLRSVPEVNQSETELETWGLRVGLDPRVVDGKFVNRGVAVVVS